MDQEIEVEFLARAAVADDLPVQSEFTGAGLP
jgi:hypothetical protein